ncbi:MAG: DAK2 domain-containing protein [Bacillota bacterium]|nr:DAK2 domain-containing protein [Bacillota bacterium]
MQTHIIDGQLLAKMLLGGTENLKANKEIVNSLNVFPVPDGDTGTNMTLTMTAAVSKLTTNSGNVEAVSQLVSKGSLMGARGNSGVILSQIFRGLAQGLKGKQDMSVKDFCSALMDSKTSAYSAVLKPVEGTMLTVIKDIAAGVKSAHKKKPSFEELFEKIMQIAQESLANTPNLLPVLKQAGVVDSGGQGLVYFFAGMKDALEGKEISFAKAVETAPKANAQMHFHAEDINFLYCTEFIVRIDREPESSFREKLESMGDSLVYVRDEDLLKVHVHTNNPGEALEMGLRHGELVTIKIENMKEQHSHIVEDSGYAAPVVSDVSPVEKLAAATPDWHDENVEIDCAFVAVASGSGIKTILQDLGVDYVIEGGQTMNPSTSDFVEAINKLNAKQFILFPNNGNIIMAAEQASAICGKHVHVVPTKTLPQCVTAVVSYDDGQSIKANLKTMKQVIGTVKTVSVTHSVRDTEMDGHKIKEGDYIAVLDKGIASAGKSMLEVAYEATEKCIGPDSSLVTIYTGHDVDEKAATDLERMIIEKHGHVEVSIHSGDQPVYYFIISVE